MNMTNRGILPGQFVRKMGAATSAWSQPWLTNPPQVIAHRGGPAVNPEETFDAYDYAARNGFALEGDARLTADGQLVLIHDATVNAMTTSTGNVSSYTLAELKAMTVDATSILGPGHPDTSLISLADLFSRYGNDVLYNIEAKESGTGAPIVALAQAMGIQPGRLMVASFFSAEFSAAQAAGFPTMLLMGDLADGTAAAASALGVNAVGCTAGTSTRIAACTAKDLSTYLWTANHRVDLAAWRALGGTGMFTDDPAWAAGTSKVYPSDPFTNRRWWPGSSIWNGYRGTFSDVGVFRQSASTTYCGTLQGWASPLPAASGTYQIDFEASFASVTSDTRWFSLFIGTDDTTYTDGTGPNGYNILCRRNGQVVLYKVTAGSAAGLAGGGSSTPGSPNTLGTFYDYRLNVTASGFTIANVTAGVTATAPDASWRGGYLWFGCNGAVVDIKNITIT